ncbi:MAG: SUMF1/EgtB/PvdO family nonheme iron enzyme [Myxococcales bacterium]|nr:SUMF1/EgtB/PvdO family nonheme iron enzyme [Myxococcales bacterium]
MATLDDARLIVLVRDKLGVPEPMLNQFRRVAAAGGRSLGELLIEMGLTSQHQLDTLVAEELTAADHEMPFGADVVAVVDRPASALPPLPGRGRGDRPALPTRGDAQSVEMPPLPRVARRPLDSEENARRPSGIDLPFNISHSPTAAADPNEQDFRALLSDDPFDFLAAGPTPEPTPSPFFGAAERSIELPAAELPASARPADVLADPFADDQEFTFPDAEEVPALRARPASLPYPRSEHGPKPFSSDELLVSDEKLAAESGLRFVGSMEYDPTLDSRPPVVEPELAPLPGRAVQLEDDSAHTNPLISEKVDPSSLPFRGPGPEPRATRRGDRRTDVLPDLHNDPSRYVLGEEIARGGMGRIVKAVDQNIDRTVAMKLLIKGKDEQIGMQLRFTEEAQITGQLQHPNIVPVYDLGTDREGQVFFTMKLVKGRTLRDILRDLRRSDVEIEKQFTRARLINAFQQVCMGIAYAHSRGVVHRDLKPSNVMFGDFGEVLVMDWGLAKILRREEDADGKVKSHREQLSRWATRHGEVIGTPGYMPPELALGQLDDVDERSDVYSLGAVLYEILTLRPPYTGRDARAIIRKMLRERVIPPRKRAPSRNIPAELEEICIRCLSKDIGQRYGSVLDLHKAIEEFQEGAMEKERQRQEATRQTAAAKGHVDDYRRHTRAAERLMAEVESERLRLPPWAGAELRRALWDAELRLDAARRERVEAFTLAAQSFRQALVANPDDAEAREGLCQLYWGGFLQAEHEGDRPSMLQYETVLRAVDTGNYAELLRGDGRLQVETDPPGARAVLFSYDETDKILTPTNPRDLGRTPVVVDPLPMGSYLLVLRAPGLRDTQVPLRIERLGEASLQVRLRTDRAIGAGFVYIPGAHMMVGGDPDASWGLPRQSAQVNDFCLARLPVSCRQYLDFLNAIATDDFEQAVRRSPRLFAGGGTLYGQRDNQFFVPERDPNGVPWDQNWPVFGISYDDALAYCKWRSRIDGIRYRLPTEIEWEVAARGADLRHFPWGNTWEPTYCKSAHSRPGVAGLEPCGSYATDRSPFGVMDLAGGVSDWTSTAAATEVETDHIERICRGGSWNHLDLHARVASRHATAAEAVSVSVGFRLAHDP